MNQSDEDALVNEIFDKSWRTEPGAQTSLFNMAESIRLAIRAAVAAERERDEARELSVQGSARLFAAMNFERDEWKRKAEEAARDAARYRWIEQSWWYVGPCPEGDTEGVSWHDKNDGHLSATIDAAIAAKGEE